jgi:hypothetical protein
MFFWFIFYLNIIAMPPGTCRAAIRPVASNITGRPPLPSRYVFIPTDRGQTIAQGFGKVTLSIGSLSNPS